MAIIAGQHTCRTLSNHSHSIAILGTDKVNNFNVCVTHELVVMLIPLTKTIALFHVCIIMCLMCLNRHFVALKNERLTGAGLGDMPFAGYFSRWGYSASAVFEGFLNQLQSFGHAGKS